MFQKYIFDSSDNVVNSGNAGASAKLVNRDFDTVGNWLGKYGQLGYYLIGSDSSLPQDVTCHVVSQDDLVLWYGPSRYVVSLTVKAYITGWTPMG